MTLTYSTGEKCKNGHLAPRRIDNKTCVKCAHAATRKWIDKNKKKVRAYAKKNYPKYAGKAQERNYKWRIDNRKKFMSQARATAAARRSRLMNADGKFSRKDIEFLFKKQKGMCACCDKSIKKKYHIDHIKALSKGGSNWPKNLQLLTPSCNIRKHNK